MATALCDAIFPHQEGLGALRLSRVEITAPGSGRAVILPGDVACHPLLRDFVAADFAASLAMPVFAVATFANAERGPTFGDVIAWLPELGAPWGVAQMLWPSELRAEAIYGDRPMTPPALLGTLAVQGVALAALGRELRPAANAEAVAEAARLRPLYLPTAETLH